MEPNQNITANYVAMETEMTTDLTSMDPENIQELPIKGMEISVLPNSMNVETPIEINSTSSTADTTDTTSTELIKSIIRDLSLISDPTHVDKISHISMKFTCKTCKLEEESLKDLFAHMDKMKCCLKPVKRRVGRPRKYPLPPDGKKTSYPKIPRWVERKNEVLESKTAGKPTTRISTGSLKRKNAAEILGLKAEDDDDLINGFQSPLAAKESTEDYKIIEDDKMEVILNIGHLLQAADKVQDQSCVGDQVQDIGCETVGRNSEEINTQGADEHESNVEEPPTAQNKSGDDLVEVSVIEELVSKYKSTQQHQKVSLVSCPKLNLIPVSPAETTKGNKIEPVITIKSEEPGGNIVIPTSTSAGERKNVVIPHALLLQALREHEDKPGNKTIIVINEDKKMELLEEKHKEITEEKKRSLDEVKQKYIDEAGIDDDKNDPDFVVKAEETEKVDDEDFAIDDAEDTDDGVRDTVPKLPRIRKSIFKRGRPPKSVPYYGNFTDIEPQSLRPHKCKVCITRFFTTELELEVHMEAHVHTKAEVDAEISKYDRRDLRSLFCCPVCKSTVPNWNRILRHMLTHKEISLKLAGTDLVRNIYGKFPCPKCRKVFDKRSNMILHWKKTHNKRAYMCEVCHREFIGIDEITFQRHLDKCKNVMYQCEHCSYSTKVSINMRRHIKIHRGLAFKCEVCSKPFPTKQRYEMHKRRHEPNRTQYSCEACDKLFLTVDAVKKHYTRFHLPSEECYSCDKCKYVSKIATDLPKHMKLVHDKKFKCDHAGCEYMTNSEPVFQQHMEYHSQDRKFKCPYPNCYYSGCTTKQLSDHCTSIHHINSRHQCPICQKFFKKKTHLLRHLVMHTGDHPYLCQECGLTFYSHSTYYRHRRKMGHDSKHDGIASVPQNIIITYVQDDGKEEATVKMSAKNREQQKQKMELSESAASLESLLLQAEEVYPTNMDSTVPLDSSHVQNVAIPQTVVDPSGRDQVVFIESSESQLFDDINRMNQVQQTMNHTMTMLPEDHLGQVMQDNLTPEQVIVTAGQIHNSVEISESTSLENIITIPEGDNGQQYTYILSTEEAQNIISGEQVTLTMPENTTDMSVGMLPKQKQMEFDQSNISQNMENVEVAPSADNGQYAILLVPSTSTSNPVPEAAMSMLQLKTSQ